MYILMMNTCNIYLVINMKNRQKTANTQNKSHQIIFDLAKQIEEERNPITEAQKIINAYRKVEEIKVPSSVKQSRNKTANHPPKIPTSNYANKIKETLREMNANRSRELGTAGTKKEIVQKIKKQDQQWHKQRSAAQRHLMSRATQKIIKIIESKFKNLSIRVFGLIVSFSNEQNQIVEHYQYRINRWKLNRVFAAWSQQTMLSKIKKAKMQHERKQKQKKQMILSKNFYNFVIMKKSLKSWKNEIKKIKRKREVEEIEKQQKRIEILRQKQRKEALMREILDEERGVQHKDAQKKEESTVLQNKLNGFLSNLKKEVKQKGRLNTIKEKTDESEIKNRIGLQDLCLQQAHEEEQAEQASSEQNNPNNDHNEQTIEIIEKKGPLTNEQLEQRRKQLAEKAKSRKQMLQKMKKEKEQKKKKQEEERIELQKQIQEQTKRQRKEQYRKYMQQKKQQEEWQQRQAQLNRQATQHNRLRLLKFYGWQNWQKLKQTNQTNSITIQKYLTKIILKRKLAILIKGMQRISNEKLQKLYSKAEYHFKKKLKQKSLRKLQQWKSIQIEEKEQLSVRHEINTLKVYFAEWCRTRQILQLENFQWQRPRLKKSEYFYHLNLLHKAFESLRQNKQTEIQERRIEEHRKKIQDKLLDIVEAEPTIDYSEFL